MYHYRLLFKCMQLCNRLVIGTGSPSIIFLSRHLIVTQPHRTCNYPANWKRKDIILIATAGDCVCGQLITRLCLSTRVEMTAWIVACIQIAEWKPGKGNKKSTRSKSCMSHEVGYYLQKWCSAWKPAACMSTELYPHIRVHFPFPRYATRYALCSDTILPDRDGDVENAT